MTTTSSIGEGLVKNSPVFVLRTKSEGPVPCGGAETEVARLKRTQYNLLAQINIAWLHMHNYIIPCEDPKGMFWSKLLGANDDWDITPTHTFYDSLKDFGTDLKPIRNYRNKPLLELMIEPEPEPV